MKRPKFIGTFPCPCGKRVRVYGTLPQRVQCATCEERTLKEECRKERDLRARMAILCPPPKGGF